MAHEARFAAAMTAITRRLPFGLSGVVAPSLVGYLLINLCTFCLDLGLLSLFHSAFGWPVPVAVTLSYGTAAVLSYALNRVLNFRSQSYVGKQFLVFAAVSASNYLIFVLGLTDLLYVAGVHLQLSRVIAACCEAVYLYCMMRWVVFRDADAAKAGPARGPARQAARAPAPTATEAATATARPAAQASAGQASAGSAGRAPAPTATAEQAPSTVTAEQAPSTVTVPPMRRRTGHG